MKRKDLKAVMAKNIKEIRLAKGWTQEMAAEKTGFHYKYYQKIESGQVNLTLDSLNKIVNAYNTNIQKLFIKKRGQTLTFYFYRITACSLTAISFLNFLFVLNFWLNLNSA